MVDELREENTLDYLAHGCSIPTRRSFELKREERRETRRAKNLRDAFGMNPLENGERENASQVRRRFHREMVEECDRDIEALERELERENRSSSRVVREKKVKSEHFLRYKI